MLKDADSYEFLLIIKHLQAIYKARYDISKSKKVETFFRMSKRYACDRTRVGICPGSKKTRKLNQSIAPYSSCDLVQNVDFHTTTSKTANIYLTRQISIRSRANLPRAIPGRLIKMTSPEDRRWLLFLIILKASLI